jgi:hypothetical protein
MAAKLFRQEHKESRTCGIIYLGVFCAFFVYSTVKKAFLDSLYSFPQSISGT